MEDPWSVAPPCPVEPLPGMPPCMAAIDAIYGPVFDHPDPCPLCATATDPEEAP